MRPRILWIAGLSGLLLLLLWCGVFPAELSAVTLAQQEEPVTHVVQSGETLFRIAQRYGTTVGALVATNAIADPSLIRVGQELIIPPVPAEEAAEEESGSAQVQRDLATYLIVPGDTLDIVARRFDTSSLALAELNGVVNPAGLPPGGWLRVPEQPVRRLHRVAENETALRLALRHGLPIWEFLTLNGLSSSATLVPDQLVWVPSLVSTATLAPPVIELDVGPVPVLQGNTVRIRADLEPGAVVQGVFDDQVLRFVAEGDTHYAFFGVHALTDPGTYTLALLVSDASGDVLYLTRSVEVVDGSYGYEEVVLPPERDAVLDPEALAAERARLAEIKTVFNPERYWDGLFLRPIDTELTSLFGTRRLYKSPSYQFYGYHEGTDFEGEIGDPVRAPAAGVVVLAEPLFVRGGAVVIDHGWGIYTGYWHLSQIDAAVGQRVVPGDQIGLVGHTGLSTGAHLHWDFWVNGTNVRALQWTEQLFP